MLNANFDLLWAKEDGKTMFWHAVMNRQEKIFNLLYGEQAHQHKDSLLSCENNENNNILHFAAMLPPPAILDRTSGPPLQMQRELQWFKTVQDVAEARYGEEANKENLTPSALFTRSHQNLLDAAEKSMKATAQSATTIGALIITMMFAATFAVPRSNNQSTGYSLLVTSGMLRSFIIFDALSLYWSTASVLVFLGVLTSRYSEKDFTVALPTRLMIGLSALFFSITTMMITFCIGITIMFNGQIRLIIPIAGLACVPIVLFVISVFPLLSEMMMSTYGRSIFHKNSEIPTGIKQNDDHGIDF